MDEGITAPIVESSRAKVEQRPGDNSEYEAGNWWKEKVVLNETISELQTIMDQKQMLHDETMDKLTKAGMRLTEAKEDNRRFRKILMMISAKFHVRRFRVCIYMSMLQFLRRRRKKLVLCPAICLF
jgi:hypothetical protein